MPQYYEWTGGAGLVNNESYYDWNNPNNWSKAGTGWSNWEAGAPGITNGYFAVSFPDNTTATINVGSGITTSGIPSFTVGSSSNITITGTQAIPTNALTIPATSTLTVSGSQVSLSVPNSAAIDGTLKIAGAASVSLNSSINGTVEFGDAPNGTHNTLTLGSTSLNIGHITNFTPGDSIVINGANYPQVRWIQTAANSNTYTLVPIDSTGWTQSAYATVSFAQKGTDSSGSPVYYTPADLGEGSTGTISGQHGDGDYTGLTYYEGNGASHADGTETIVCFLAGSMIRTTAGDIAVEDIQIGDQVIAFDWKNNEDVTRPVVWVGKAHATVRPELHDDEAGWPVRILKDAVADGVPYKDMLITAEHCLFFKDRFVPVRMLVNGVSIFYDKSITSYDYYHVETEQHSVITADGMLTESYLETGNRSSFRQEGKVVTLFGSTKSWEDDAGAPLGVDRSFVEPLFRAIEWREDKVSKEQAPAAPELTNDPDLHLVTETGAVVRPMRKAAHEYSFMLPPSTQSVRIVSRASRPSDVIGPFVDDRRSMGVAVADVRLLCAKKPFEITSHLQTEKPEGWHETDWTDCAWTNGNAELPLGEYLAHGEMGILSITVRAAGPYIVDNQKTEKTVKSA
ncbi:Hint domain-containing protein [Acetobacter persici]|uniref:Hint domain-containing protein n=1 Tax=Acetobacter persici TaxID=1076596 RepID=UPI0020CD1B2A|nr:Hint domain-containing protein [Acetobacter persici]MCP9319098.1 Hint domain-containing protein [Acetobacter persici]